MNIVTLTGRLTREPEVKSSKNGDAYCRFTLAVDNPFKKDDTNFINCVAFRKTASLIGDYLNKGSKIAVAGSISTGHYMKDDQRINTFEVTVNNLEFLDSKKKVVNEEKIEKKSFTDKVIDTFESEEFPF